MRKLIWLALLLPFTANAATAVTQPSTLACLTKDWLSEALTFAVNNDTASLQAYIDRGQCIILKGGLTVTITDAGFMTHEFVIRGIKLYTPAENLRLR